MTSEDKPGGTGGMSTKLAPATAHPGSSADTDQAVQDPESTVGGAKSSAPGVRPSVRIDVERAETKGKKTKPHSTKPNSKGNKVFMASWLALGAILIALVGGVLGYWVTDQSTKGIEELQGTMAQGRQETDENLQQIARLREKLGVMEQRHSKISKVLEENHQQRVKAQANLQHLQDSMNALSSRVGNTSTTWILAEAEYLLTVANQRLLLERDIVTAIDALNAADRRLKETGDPGLFAIRRIITDEINALRSVNVPDVTSIALELSSLAAVVERLPLVATEQSPDLAQTVSIERPGPWDKALKAAWTDIKGLVKIRRRDHPIVPLMAPDQQLFLYQNLRLKLDVARLSLLRNETTMLRTDLQQVLDWLLAYFDPEDAAVRNFQATLSRVQNIDLKPELPDIAGALRALRQLRSERGLQSSSRRNPQLNTVVGKKSPGKRTAPDHPAQPDEPTASKTSGSTREPAL